MPVLPSLFRVVLTALTATLFTGPAAHAQSVYTVIDLGSLGGPFSAATALNATGQVVGYSLLPDGETVHPFLYVNGRIRDLGTPDDGVGKASGINDAGQVAGYFVTRNTGQYHPFLYSSDAGINDLALDNPRVSSYAGTYTTGLNAAGQVAGFISSGEPVVGTQGFLLTPGQTVNFLIPLGTAYGASAFAINDSGQVAGSSTVGFNPYTATYHATIFEDQGRRGTDLGALGGSTSISIALAINNAGQAAGFSAVDSRGSAFHAFLYRPGVGLTDLGSLNGLNSMANGINARGDVVGDLFEGMPGRDYPVGVFRYTAAEGTVDLNRLVAAGSGWTLLSAAAINDAGQIVGYGLNPEQAIHAYLLTPGVAPVTPPMELPVVSVVGTAERGGFVISRTGGSVSSSLVIRFHNGGSAIRGTDYVPFPDSITLSAGLSEIILPVELLPGANRSKKVKVFLDPSQSGNYSVGKAQSKVFLSDLP